MDRTVNKAKSFAEADECEIRQHLAMTPQERMRVAKQLKERAYPGKNPDVREWHRSFPPNQQPVVKKFLKDHKNSSF